MPAGTIVFEKTMFQASPPNYFILQLHDLLGTGLRDKEANVRLLIGHYLTHAVKEARRQFQKPRIAFASELDVPGEIVENVGIVSGTLDFVCANVAGEGSLGTSLQLYGRLMKDGLMDGPDGAQDYVLDTPYLIVLEVKKSDTLLLHSAKAELLGQIRVLLQKLFAPFRLLLTGSGDKGRTGILTDSFVWKLFHLDSQFRLFTLTVRAETDDERIKMLCIDPMLSIWLTS